ncbi:hypothetical protein B0H17DRAFT_43973 [Mycena rosella]|uniref:Uncharacterized protein n=1 Tax=Mycena rosella TaxID=1033263 RepID=A0AAD7GCT6_MYCRO|nr:hypothetical protein B0H17DRAFT_43973 [Mycena rosella]
MLAGKRTECANASKCVQVAVLVTILRFFIRRCCGLPHMTTSTKAPALATQPQITSHLGRAVNIGDSHFAGLSKWTRNRNARRIPG